VLSPRSCSETQVQKLIRQWPKQLIELVSNNCHLRVVVHTPTLYLSTTLHKIQMIIAVPVMTLIIAVPDVTCNRILVNKAVKDMVYVSTCPSHPPWTGHRKTLAAFCSRVLSAEHAYLTSCNYVPLHTNSYGFKRWTLWFS